MHRVWDDAQHEELQGIQQDALLQRVRGLSVCLSVLLVFYCFFLLLFIL